MSAAAGAFCYGLPGVFALQRLTRCRYTPVMAFDLVETIKLIGGLSGLASASFLIYDRLIRFRPVVSFRPHNNSVTLAIRNAMPESLIVDQITITPPYLGVQSRDGLSATLAIIDAAVEARDKSGSYTSSDFLIVDPLTEKLYPLIWVVKNDDLPSGATIRIRCQWRSTGKPFLFKRSITVSTTVMDVLQMQAQATDPAGWLKKA